MCYTLKILKYSFNRGDTKYHGGLRSRELCQAPIMQALSSHSRVCESKLSSWNNFFQSCQGQALNRVPSDKKASAKSTPPRGTHYVLISLKITCTCQGNSFHTGSFIAVSFSISLAFLSTMLSFNFKSSCLLSITTVWTTASPLAPFAVNGARSLKAVSNLFSHTCFTSIPGF